MEAILTNLVDVFFVLTLLIFFIALLITIRNVLKDTYTPWRDFFYSLGMASLIFFVFLTIASMLWPITSHIIKVILFILASIVALKLLFENIEDLILAYKDAKQGPKEIQGELVAYQLLQESSFKKHYQFTLAMDENKNEFNAHHTIFQPVLDFEEANPNKPILLAFSYYQHLDFIPDLKLKNKE